MRHPASTWRWHKLAQLTQDPEVHVLVWLRDGALVGIASSIPPSGLFAAECHSRKVDEPCLCADPGGNSKSFDCDFGDRTGLAQILEMETKGFVTIYASLKSAKSACGSVCWETCVISNMAE
eukprot:2277522-Amphidinium_carterae.3